MTKIEWKEARFSLLQWLHYIIIGLLVGVIIVVLVVTPTEHELRNRYMMLLGLLMVLSLIGYGFFRLNIYHIPAAIIVSLPIIGSWGSLLIDPSVYSSDMFPLSYTVLSVVLSSILFQGAITTILASVQCISLVLLIICSPTLHAHNWASFLIFIISISILSIVTNHLLRRRSEELFLYAFTDELTGLFNRRYFEATLDQILRRTGGNENLTKKATVGLILLDIDYFKGFNDTYGHLAGDHVLREVAQFLQKYTPLESITCRYGGDEFVIICNGKVISIAEEICARIGDVEMEKDGKHMGTVSLSLGVSLFPDHQVTRTKLLEQADSALLKAKREGRARVIVYEAQHT